MNTDPRPRDRDADARSGSPTDPVLERRAQVQRWTLLANRVGYLFLAVSIAVFVIALAVGFSAPLASAVLITLLISFALLAPSIILGYAVKAADRADREMGW